MFKTKVAESLNKSDMIAVSPETLAGMLNCGRATAVKIGTDAGAKILIGRRTLYKVSIVDKYLNLLAGK
ncbi:MAG: hypothetical protein HFG75_10865 [Hungatella sp.]|nr:hypothetical protein [Hungatella sp.]